MFKPMNGTMPILQIEYIQRNWHAKKWKYEIQPVDHYWRNLDKATLSTELFLKPAL